MLVIIISQCVGDYFVRVTALTLGIRASSAAQAPLPLNLTLVCELGLRYRLLPTYIRELSRCTPYDLGSCGSPRHKTYQNIVALPLSAMQCQQRNVSNSSFLRSSTCKLRNPFNWEVNQIKMLRTLGHMGLNPLLFLCIFGSIFGASTTREIKPSL